MDSCRIFDFNIICRVCLGYEIELKSLQSESADMMNFIQFMEVCENDNLPNHICTSCDKTLHDTYNFKQKCIASTKTLQKLLENVADCGKTDCDRELDSNILGHISCGTGDSGDTELQTVYSCPRCSLTFVNEHLLQEHLLEETDITKNADESVEAEQLNEKYIKIVTRSLEKDLTSSTKTNTSPFPYQCSKCVQSFKEESDLDLHMSIHTTGDMVCKSCNKLFRNRQLLKRHIKTHMMYKPYICQKCGNGYAESHSLTKHMKTHMGIPREKKHFCDECGQGFSEPYYLRVHKRKHTGERPLVCTTCQKSFADPRSLKVHNMAHSREKPYKCHYCPKGFSQSVNLTKHIRVHTGEKPYACTICDKRFTQSSSLDKHNRTHTGEKPFACSSCPKRFSEKGTLIYHLRTHTREKPYTCKVCNKSFASSSELKLHDRKHSGIKKNICNTCGKDFATPSSLIIHIRTHTGEKPFECNICSKKFSDRSGLNKHEALIHSRRN